MQAASWLQPKILSAQTQDTLVLKLPWLRPERFRPIAAFTEAGNVPWLVMVHVLIPLMVASTTAPTTLTVQMLAKFDNPQLVWPRSPPTSAAPRGWTNMVRQSSRGLSTPKAKGSMSKVGTIRSAGNPIADAESGLSSTTTSTVGSITQTMSSAMESVDAVASILEPLMSLVAMFDKPQMPDEAGRMFLAPATNFTVADVRDQGYSLAINRNSYASTAADIVPNSQGWTWQKLAMTPALVYTIAFTNTETLFSIPQVPNGTPFAFAAMNHAFWRGGTRFLLKFYASSFVSGRILVTYNPPETATLVSQVNDNYSRIFDVKGDTTVSFTVPFVYQTDFAPQFEPVDSEGNFVGCGLITFSVYNPIISTDTSTDAVISLAVFAAAAPDCQFSLCQPSGPQFAYAPTFMASTMEKQCDIQESFEPAFEPLIAGCSYLTDHKIVTAETSEHLIDLLKRYQLYHYNYTCPDSLSLNYQPDPTTFAASIKSCFLFHRGGVNYKYFPTGSTQQQIQFRDPYDGNVPPAASPVGQPFIVVGQSSDELDFSIPWYSNVPYIIPFAAIDQYTGSLLELNYSVAAPTPPTHCTSYTCVRDDYQMGFLIPPVPSTLIPPTQRTRHVARPRLVREFEGTLPKASKREVPPIRVESTPRFAGLFGTSLKQVK